MHGRGLAIVRACYIVFQGVTAFLFVSLLCECLVVIVLFRSAGSAATAVHTRRRSRALRFSRRCTAAQLARKRKMPWLCNVLKLEDSASLFICVFLYQKKSSAPGRGRVAITIRAAASFHGTPRYGWQQYRGPGGNKQFGQAALVVQSRTGRRKQLVVWRVEEAAPRESCVLTGYWCQRLR